MAIVKIFLPKDDFRKSMRITEYLYGAIIRSNASETLHLSVLVTDIEPKNHLKTGQLVGIIESSQLSENTTKNNVKDFLYFERIESSGILQLKSIHQPTLQTTAADKLHYRIQLVLYDLNTFSNLATHSDVCNEMDSNVLEPITYLIKMLRFIKEQEINNCTTMRRTLLKQTKEIFQKLCILLLTISTFVSMKILNLIESAFLRHYIIWSASLKQYTFQSGKAWTIVFDVITGMILMLFLWRISDPGEYLLKFTELIVKQLRHLLESLKGSPVGLKLNIELNNFFLGCFRYHIDLWATFLVIIAPLIKYLFAPLAVLGCLGLSFQLAMLADLLNIITLHAHIIYIYAAILYRLEIVGLAALWRVVSGRRKNVLKDRIESYDYTNPQLYLSTMFFTALLFLLPTFLVYYVVFASLRFGFYCITYTFMKIQRKLLTFPICDAIKWCFGQYVSAENIEVKFLNYLGAKNDSKYSTMVYSIEPAKCAFPEWIAFENQPLSPNQIDENNERHKSPLTISQFLIALLKGEVMGFVQPKQNQI